MICLAVPVLLGIDRPPGLSDVTEVRHWSYPTFTRVVVELTRPVATKVKRLGADRSGRRPERLYLDLPGVWVGLRYEETHSNVSLGDVDLDGDTYLVCAGAADAITGIVYRDQTGIIPPENVDVILAAPKGSGTTVRTNFLDGSGINSSFAIHQDYTGRAKERTIAQVGDLPHKQQYDAPVKHPKTVEPVRTQHPLKPEADRQQPYKPALANRAPKATVLPGSNFDAFDNFGPTRAHRAKEKEEHKPSERLNEDYLETPTYLRKKAN